MSTESTYPGPKHGVPAPVQPAPVQPAPVQPATLRSATAADALSTAPAQGTDVSIGKLVHDATQDISTLIRGEVELAKLELKSSVKSGGFGIVFFLVAAIILVFSLIFGFIALAEGLVALHLWRWAAYLAVFGALVLFAGLFAFVGFKKVKKVRAPKRTIETTKDTVAYLRHPTQSS